MSFNPADHEPFRPPVDLTWTREGDGFYWTAYEGQRWALVVRSADLGKRGWSGTNEWHLDQLVSATSMVTNPGRWLVSAGRGTRITKVGLDRAQRLAAWVLANLDQQHRLTMDDIHQQVFGRAI